MKKKILSVILTCVLAFGMLTACGGSSNSASGNDSDDVSSITLIFSQRDEWLSTLETGAREAADELGIKLNVQDAQLDSSKQIQFIETARNDGQKVVIVNMVDPEAAAQYIEAAGDMKVVFVNRFPTDESVLNENVVYVGSNENYSGKFQGEWLADYFNAKGQTDIKYILLNGILGQTSTTLRTASVLQALKDNGINATEATAPLAADYDRATAQDKIAPLVTTIDYDAIISNNDSMALGAIEALKAKGIDPSTIPIVGIDATADGRQAVKDGELSMTVFQNAYGQGFGALMAAGNLLKGNSIAEGTEYETDDSGFILWVPFEPVTIENVKDFD